MKRRSNRRIARHEPVAPLRAFASSRLRVRPRLPRSSFRAGCAPRGVSLMEVLIAMFVLSMGLLGVAAVIPLAGHEMLQAFKADRSSACAQAALRDIRVRGILNPGDLRGYNFGTGDWRRIGEDNEPSPSAIYFEARRGYEFGESYAIDPLYIAENWVGVSGGASFGDFPYNPRSLGTPNGPGANRLDNRWTRMQRVYWTGVGTSKLLASAAFHWHDDKLFPLPDDETQRPDQLLRRDGSGNALQSEFKGDYSWLVTVTPSPEHIDFTKDMGGPFVPYSFTENSPLYTVSVVVFYKRDMSAPAGFGGDEPPAERQVRLEFLGTGLGGGDVRLHVLGEPANPGTWDPAHCLDVKQNEWLLVSGGYPRSCYYPMTMSPPYSPWNVGVHKWYRVVAAGEIVIEDKNGNGALDAGEDSNGNGTLDPPYREVTLAGPDWNLNWCSFNLDNDPATADAYASLFRGIVAVHSTDMKIH